MPWSSSVRPGALRQGHHQGPAGEQCAQGTGWMSSGKQKSRSSNRMLFSRARLSRSHTVSSARVTGPDVAGRVPSLHTHTCKHPQHRCTRAQTRVYTHTESSLHVLGGLSPRPACGCQTPSMLQSLREYRTVFASA